MNANKANNTYEKVRQLQRKLYRSAKLNSKRKFHALYDKVYRMDFLEEGWNRVRTRKGSGGIDGVQIADVEAYGVNTLLFEIQEELKSGSYRPRAVKRTYIDKPDGSQRPLGIPIIKDRIVQASAKLVLESIYEADFKDFSYGFRPKRSNHQALKAVRNACNGKRWWVLDVDIKSYFDTINHEKLMLLLKQRVNDRRMLKLIRLWLESGVIVDGIYEGTVVGSPQGGVISPLLSNIYLHYMDTVWEKYGSHLGSLIRFADDSVVICRTRKEAVHSLNLIQEVMRRLDLTLHPDKTKLVCMWNGKEGFDFLGMHHRYSVWKPNPQRRHIRLRQFPSRKAMQRMRDGVREKLGKRNILWKNAETLIKELNPILRGWRNYYGLSTAKHCLHKIDCYILKLFTRWYNKKRSKSRKLSNMDIVLELLKRLKLVRLAV